MYAEHMTSLPPDLSGFVNAEYSRISDAAREKERGTDASGVGRQSLDSSLAITSRNGVVTKHYIEDDTSAFKQKRVLRRDAVTNEERWVYRVIRPVWQQALQDFRDRKIDILVVNDLDRLARDLRDLEDAIEVVEHYGARIYGSGGDIDLMSDNGRMAARIAVTVANKSSSDTRRRVTRKHAQLATSGGAVGGVRPFGWSEDRVTLHPVESVHLRRWIDMRLEGASLSEITRDSQAQGVVGTRGRPMKPASLRQLLYSARLCSYRMFHGKLALDADGTPVVGVWAPICTPVEWEQMTKDRPLVRDGGSPASVGANKYLLSGIARCGVCKARMHGAKRTGRKPGKNYNSYICPPAVQGGHMCVARNIEDVDRVVMKAVLAWASTRKGVPNASTVWPDEAGLTDAEARLETYLQDAAKGNISNSMLYRMLPTIEAEIKDLRRARAAWHEANDQQLRAATDTWSPEFWATRTLSQKRAALSAVILAIEIHRVDRGISYPFDPSKIQIIWRNP